MPLNTTAALLVLAARRHLSEKPRACEVFHQTLEISDQCLKWLIAQEPALPFLKADALREMLPLSRRERHSLVPDFYQALGFESWMSIDSHSRDGSVVMDFNLNFAREYGYTETFDFVDNNGATEHVFDQRAAFENIHNLSRVGGVMLHKIPTLDVLNIALYGVTPVFLHDLALANGYEILEYAVGNRWGDSVRVRLRNDDPAPHREFHMGLPARQGFARGCAQDGPGDDACLPPHETPPELELPPFLELREFLEKAPLASPKVPLARVCHILTNRARCFRPDNPGELYAMAIFRKVSDAPFKVPYQSKYFDYIDAPEWRQRYKNQFEVWEAAKKEEAARASVSAGAPADARAEPAEESWRRPQLEIKAVSPGEVDPRCLLGFGIDAPQTGHKTGEYSIDVSGWIVGQRSAAKQVEVHASGVILCTTDVWLPRADISAHVTQLTAGYDRKKRLGGYLRGRPVARILVEAEKSGFHASVSLLGQPEKFKLRVKGVLADGTRVDLGQIRGQRQPLRTVARQPRMQPLMLSGLGRSGTSWFINLLGAHPEIITHLKYPFISRVAIHAMRVFQVQSKPSNPVRTAEMQAITKQTDTAGPLPLYCREEDPDGQEWLRRDHVERLATQTQDNIDAFYTGAAGRAGKPGARYFAEKAFLYPLIAPLFAELYPQGKEVFLVRDFRDVACSRKEFHDRRPDEKGLSREHHIKDTADRAKTLHVQWKNRAARAHLVRYEDLVTDPVTTLAGLFSYLEIQCDDAFVRQLVAADAERTPELKQHRTKRNEAETIGRWRQDFTREELRHCEEQCGAALREFGYLPAT